jgi:glycosyltransferase involved in cell wall biosynthesis
MTARRPLRIAVLGDFDSIHTQRWLSAFVERGHEMHAVSFYHPRSELPGVNLHVLRSGGASAPGEEYVAAPSPLRTALRSPLRLVHGARYWQAGLRRAVREIKPDVFHAHFLVEFGFYGSLAGYRPYVVSAWGSDVFREPQKLITNLVARWTIRRAQLVTASDAAMLASLRRLGVKEAQARLVRIGALEELFFSDEPTSVNLGPDSAPPLLLSTRALEPLYNVDRVLRAFAVLHKDMPEARLQVAGEGSQRMALEALARDLALDNSVAFLGRLTPPEMRDALSAAHVYVSVPSSDSLAASTMEAMARGAFPVVADLPSLDGFIENGVNGLCVSGDVMSLASALRQAVGDAAMRRAAVAPNRRKIEAEGRLSAQVDRLEAAFYELAAGKSS